MRDRNTMTAEDITRSHRAVRTAAGWLERADAGLLEVRGADRLSWLQGLLTNDVAILRPGQGCYAAYLTPQGRMLSDLRVLVREQGCWLDVPQLSRDRVRDRFEMFIISEDVEVDDLGPRVARIGVHGPASAASLGALLELDGASAAGVAELAEHAHLSLQSPLGEVTVAGSRDLGGPGFDLYVARENRAALSARANAIGLLPIVSPAWDLCRVEAGRPAYGADMDEDTIPLEAGIEDRAISFTKGCYVGQEVIVRVRDRGHGRVARRLVGFVAASAVGEPGAPAVGPGDVFVAADREAGRVTSAAFSPSAGTTIGLGYVQRDLAVDGQAIDVQTAAGRVPVALRRSQGPLVPLTA